MSAPLRAVLSALADGAATRSAVVTVTGLSSDVVDAALEHLVRMGRVQTRTIGVGCPAGGCGHCPVASACTGRGVVGWSVGHFT